MKKLTFLLLFVHSLLINGQCDVAITDVNLNTYEVTVEVINSENCLANGLGGVPGKVTQLQIGYHIPEPINSDNEIIEDFNETFGLPPCSPNWPGYLGQNPNSNHPSWWYSPSISVTFTSDIMGDGLITGDIVTIPLNPPGDYVNTPYPLAECGDDLIDYWLSEGECIEFVVWQLNYGNTWYASNGGWATSANNPDFAPGTYQDQNCNNSWYLCRDENPGAPVANPDFCEVILDECNDPIACNYNENWGEIGGFCIYCDTPGGEELCNEYQNIEGYWDFYFNAFDCTPPSDTVYIEVIDTIYVELPSDTIYVELPSDTIYETDTLIITVTEIDTLYIELPPDTITITETEFIFVTDTVVETEYITLIDTTYVLYTDTVLVYEFIEIDCETGLPCSEFRNECNIYIPNAFTPDNDGYNDVWEIILDPECWTDVKARVVSRWGNVVWQSSDSNNLIWDGSLESGDYYVQNEMYMWLLQARKVGTTELKDLRGHVTILR
jgi:gliding motility-associated-like protein